MPKNPAPLDNSQPHVLSEQECKLITLFRLLNNSQREIVTGFTANVVADSEQAEVKSGKKDTKS